VSERVYPLDFCPTDNPHVWVVFMRNDGAEFIEAHLHIVTRGDRETIAPSAAEEFERIAASLIARRPVVAFDGTY
jgi:hypothetical protein